MLNITDEVRNPNIQRQILHQLMLINGYYGKHIIEDGGDPSPEGYMYRAIAIMTDTKFSSITDLSILQEDKQNAYENVEFSAGDVLIGLFTEIEVDEGKVACYINKPYEE